MKQLFLLLAFVAIAQVTWGQETGMVNGKIVQKGTATPLAGASILIKSKKVGTVTDSLGQFELEAAIGDTIQVIYGEASKTFEVYTFLPLMVALTLDTDRQHNALSFQAGSLPLAHLGATEQVTTDHFNPIHLTDPAQLFTGQFAGLNLQRPDGDPTSAFDLRIRGFTSLTQQYEPLILVDGVPEANYRLIDPQEIESIQIVKDLATAASYGVRAANGIIDIRLKEVSQQKPRLEYRAYSAFSSPTATVDVLDAAQYRTAIGNNFFDGVDGGQATDWQEEILRSTAFSNSHQLSFSGQVDELRYRASLHYRDIQGVIQQSGYEQVGARLFLDYTTLKGRLQLRHSTTINNRATEDFNYNQALGGELGSRNAPITYAIQANPTFPVWENDDPASGQYSAPFNPFFAENPLSRLNQTVNEQEQTFALSTTTAIVKVMEGLEVEATYGLVYQDQVRGFQAAPNAVLRELAANKAALTKQLERQHLIEGRVRFQKSWGEHELLAMGGYAHQYNIESTQSFFTDAVPDNLLYEQLDDANQFPTGFEPITASARSSRTLSSYFLSAAYQLQGFSVAANFRQDGASSLGIDNQWSTFIGVTGAFDFAGLWSDFPLVTQLRLRAGYGQAGNLPATSFLSQSLVGTDGSFTFFDGQFVPNLDILQASNPNLGAEQSQELNFGADVTFFNGRVRGSLDLFTKRSEELIIRQFIDIDTPFGKQQFANAAKLTNLGADGFLAIDLVQKPSFSWTLGLRGSVYRNEIDALAEGSEEVSPQSFISGLTGFSPLNSSSPVFFYQEGNRLGQFIGPQFLGANAFGFGDFADLNGDGIFCGCSDDFTSLGDGLPDITLALTNSFRFGNWDASIQIRGAFGHELVHGTRLIFENRGIGFSSNILASTLDFPARELLFAGNYSDFYVEDADFVTIDYISLGYRFSDHLRVYTSLNQWFTFSSYSGLSPEPRYSQNGDQLSIGIESFNDYYPERSFLLGVELRL